MEEEMVEAIQGWMLSFLGQRFSIVIDHADRLKIVSRHGWGWIRLMEYLKKKALRYGLHAMQIQIPCADHTVGLMLSVCHNITEVMPIYRSHVWKKADCKGFISEYRRYSGLGAIGKQLQEG